MFSFEGLLVLYSLSLGNHLFRLTLLLSYRSLNNPVKA